MTSYSNEELVSRLQTQFDTDDFQILHARFMPLYRKMSLTIRIHHFDLEDYKQEGQIALYHAIQSFNPLQGTYFASYFQRIYRNRMINHYRSTTAQRRIPQNRMISIDQLPSDSFTQSEYNWADILYDSSMQICETFSVKEQFVHYINSLSPLEKNVLIHRMIQENNSSKNIAKIMNLNPRTVENALARCWRKSKKYL